MILNNTDIKHIKDLLYEANSIAKFYQKGDLEVYAKPDNSPVTKADIEISKYLERGLSDKFSSIETISEEGDQKFPETDLFWLIDPIDGTRNYIKGNKLYTINIGLIDKNKATYGFITIPESDRIYFTPDPKNFVVEESGEKIEFKFSDEEFKGILSYEAKRRSQSIEVLKKYNITNYQFMPCSAKFCLVATGEADLYPRYGPTMEWDTAAGSAIINASGGKILRIDESEELMYKKPQLLNQGFLACSKRLAEVHEFC